MYSVYELTNDFTNLSAMLDEASNDADAVEAIKNTIEGISGTVEGIVENACKFVRNIEIESIAIKAEIDRLKGRFDSKIKQADSVENAIKGLLLASNMDKVKTSLFTVTLAKARSKVEVFDEKKLPDDFVRVKTTTEPDKIAIKAALDAGQEVEGAKIVLGERSLSIK